MFKNIWSKQVIAIPFEDITRLSKDILELHASFVGFLSSTGVTMEEFAGALCEDDLWVIEQASISEEYQHLESDEVFKEISGKWEAFMEAVLCATGIQLDLYYPDSSITGRERKVFLTVLNGFIPNPKITPALHEKMNHEAFLFGE